MALYKGSQKTSPIVKVGSLSPSISSCTVTPTTTEQTITAPIGTDGYNPIIVNAVTSAIDANITAGNIKDGVTILGVTGNVTELKGETKTVNPTTSQQTVSPSSGKNGITELVVNAVTSAIDSNIVAGNIKKDVSILGVTGSYEGGSATLIAKTITANGTYSASSDNADGYSSVIVDVEGGGDSGGEFLVKVIDYDGTILKQDHLNTGATFTLPSNPSHTGLTFQTWSSPVAITNSTITVGNSDITIGALYTTTSELSEFDITLTASTGLTVNLKLNGTKNWGDGTSDTATSHTYATAGDYTITCNGTTITSSSSSGLFAQSSSSINYYVKEVRLAEISTIPNYTFAYCRSLRHVSLSNSVTSIGTNAFYYDYALTSLTLPTNITAISNNLCYYCSSLESVVIPSNVSSIGSSAFYYCSSLLSVSIPNNVSNISGSAFQYCYSLVLVYIPPCTIGTNIFQYCYSLYKIIVDNISTINSSTFLNDYSAVEYNFINYSSVPTLSNINAFSNINAICRIKVPSSLESTWKTENYWSTYADYIVGV